MSLQSERWTGIREWIGTFCPQISHHVRIGKEKFEHVCERKITDVDNFRKEIVQRLAKSENAIRMNLQKPTLVMWPEGSNPTETIMEDVWGCTAKCPFCHEPCTHSKKSHAGISHDCMQHRPRGVSGWHVRGTDVIVLEGCNYSVGSDRQFYCSRRCHGDSANRDDTHYYRDYKKYFSGWDIEKSTQVDECSKFWCWFMVKYESKLLDHYNIKAKTMPSHWKNITLQQAKQSLT